MIGLIKLIEFNLMYFPNFSPSIFPAMRNAPSSAFRIDSRGIVRLPAERRRVPLPTPHLRLPNPVIANTSKDIGSMDLHARNMDTAREGRDGVAFRIPAINKAHGFLFSGI